MEKKILVAEMKAYATPSAQKEDGKAKGLYSVGMSLASRLNGNIDFTGTYNPNRTEKANPLIVGYVVFRTRFGNVENAGDAEKEKEALMAANEFVEQMSSKYPVGHTLNPLEWEWGEINEDATIELNEPGVEIRYVEYISPEERAERAARKNSGKKELEFKGKVTEPVS